MSNIAKLNNIIAALGSLSMVSSNQSEAIDHIIDDEDKLAIASLKCAIDCINQTIAFLELNLNAR